MKALRFTEKMMIALAAIGVVLKFTNGGGGGLLIVISLSVLAMIYFGGGILLFRERETNSGSTLVSGFASLCAAVIVAGIMFRLLYWPGSSIQLLAGMVTASAVVVIGYLRRRGAQDPAKDRYYSGLVNRFLIKLAFAAILFSVPQSAMVRYQYRSDPQYAELLVNYLSDPENRAHWENLARYEMQRISP
jgi:hypothetical protein